MTRKLVHIAGAVITLMFSFTASAGQTLWHTFTTTKDGGTTYRVSTEGNVYSIESPTGYEHVYSGSAGERYEGYVLCYPISPLLERSVYDLASDADGGFSAATHSSAAPFTVTRKTFDDRLQLKQVFTFNATAKSLNIVMTITNLTGLTMTNVVLNRVMDSAVDSGGTKGSAIPFLNWHAATHDAVSVWNDPATYGLEAHGLVLRHLTQSAGGAHYGLILLDCLNCHTTGQYTPSQGGYSSLMHYVIPSIAPGASKSMTIQYVRD